MPGSVPPGWVVAVTWLLAPEVLPAASRALTVNVYEVPPVRPETVAEVPDVDVATEPSR